MTTLRYDLAPGQLVEIDTERRDPLTEDELADARDRLERGQRLDGIAKRLGARVYEPESAPVARVAVDPDELERLLERAYPDERERAKVREQAVGRG